jgi:acetamidase/formamidase
MRIPLVATTHEFPTERVHYTWDDGHEPVPAIESVDLRISEVVDAGQYVVSALLPLAVLTPKG